MGDNQNNMRKNLLSLMVLAALAMVASSAHAAKNPSRVETPYNSVGGEAHPDNAGWLAQRNSSTEEMIVCSGRCLLRAVIMSTGPTASYVRIRNTAITNGSTSSLILPKYLRFNPSVDSGPGRQPLVAPILLDKGISVQLSSVSADEDVIILYRDLD